MMKHTLICLMAAFPVLAPSAEAGSASTPVAEIVTYRLKDGVSQAEHLAAAQGTRAFLNETGAVISRTLSVDADGQWTDHILWRSLDAAKATEAQAMQRPEFVAFFSGMDESSVTLRHAPVQMQMDAHAPHRPPL